MGMARQRASSRTEATTPQLRAARFTANTRLLSARCLAATLEQGRCRLSAWAWQQLVASAEFGRAREAVAKSLSFSRLPLTTSNAEEQRARRSRNAMSPLEMFAPDGQCACR